MSGDDSQITVPGWAFKWGLGILQAIMMTALIATITWAWNMEGRVTEMGGKVSSLEADLAAARVQLKTVGRHDTEIEVLKTELKYIRDGIDDVKDLVRER